MKFKKIAGIMTAAMMILGTAAIMPVSAEDTVLHSADFEAGTDGWASFGGTAVSTTNNSHHEGNCCLYVGNRSDSWQGASLSGESILLPGKTYQFSAWVLASGSDTIQLTLKYTDSSGNAQYKGISSAESSGTWAQINASYEIPSDASDILIYFQTAAGTNDFMVDDVTIKGEASWSTEALDKTPLKDVYANYFKIGCAATPAELNTTISQEIVKHHFNSLTPGNELKPDAVLNQAASQAIGDNVTPAISLDNARYTLKFCEENQIPVRGHVLCWYSQTPDWFFKEGFRSDGAYVSKEIMNQRLENYIRLLMNQIAVEFPDLNVYCWDVVNECYLDDGSLRKGGTDPSKEESYWTLIYGDNSYIEQAFTYARKYAPQGTKLFYNDFNEYIPAKRDAIYNMISDLKSKNLIDGVGMQSHLDVGYPDANLYQQCIEKYSQLGLEIQITELDITQYKSNGDLSKQTQAYHDIVKTIIDQKKAGANITALVFWGITDGTSWRKDGLPLLLNSDYSLKDSYTQVESLIPQEEWGKADETQPTETEPTTEEIILPPGSYIPGDVNLDKKVNIYDLILLKKKILAGDTAILYYENRESDVNHDGVINLSDIILLQKYLLGLIDTFD